MVQKDNKPFQIRPSRPLLKRLDAVTERFKMESANKVAVEILRDCIDIWEEAAQAFEDTIKRRAQAGQAIKNAMLNRLVEADAKEETSAKPAAKRKPR